LGYGAGDVNSHNAAICGGQAGNPLNATEVQEKEAGTELPPVNLESLIRQMLVANPELQAARKRWEAAQNVPGRKERSPTPRSGSAGPAPERLILEPDWAANRQRTSESSFPRCYRFQASEDARQHSQQEARAESFMFEGSELNLVSRLKSAFYELQFAYDAINVLTRNRTLLERLAKLAENRLLRWSGNPAGSHQVSGRAFSD